MATNKFDVVFSYCGDNIKEFILLLPYNKSLEMYELNDQKIQYLTAPNINIHKMSLSNITIERATFHMGIILVVYYPIYHVLKATYQTPSFQMEKLIISSLKKATYLEHHSLIPE